MTTPLASEIESLRPELERGLQALGLDAALSAPLLEYVALLTRWNATYNLTAVRDPREMIGKHLLDSLAMQRFVRHLRTLADLGTGPGLPPGWRLAAVHPLRVPGLDAERHLVEIVRAPG